MSEEQLKPPVNEHDHVAGRAGAPVTLVEYGDYQCPYCLAAYPVLKGVQQQMGDRLRFVFRNFPISEAHPHAEHAAEAAESVAARGGMDAFWAMHDLLYEHQQDSLMDDALASYAAEAGVPAHDVLDDLEAERYRAKVRADFMSGVRSGVNGTPTLFINGVRYDGPRDEETLVAVLTEVADGPT
jgi:protein-disulfide isomerase